MPNCLEAEVTGLLVARGADLVRYVDIASQKKCGYPRAVLICMALSKEFILAIHNGLPTASDEYLVKEQAVEALADELAALLNCWGFHAHSQSEASNLQARRIETGYAVPSIESGISLIPQKTIACIAGLGTMGKNNLLITEQYGCAVCMCSVLTDAPLSTNSRPHNCTENRCSGCEQCVRRCPCGALSGRAWTEQAGRSGLLDITKCRCALLCMAACPWTLRYARST